LTNVYPQTQPVVVTVTPTPPAPVQVNQIFAGAINQPLVAYHHVQNTPSASWLINHNLEWIPNVTVQDSAGNIVEGEISYTNSKKLTVSFSAAFSGNAYLS
jgi:hypothetical protein